MGIYGSGADLNNVEEDVVVGKSASELSTGLAAALATIQGAGRYVVGVYAGGSANKAPRRRDGTYVVVLQHTSDAIGIDSTGMNLYVVGGTANELDGLIAAAIAQSVVDGYDFLQDVAVAGSSSETTKFVGVLVSKDAA